MSEREERQKRLNEPRDMAECPYDEEIYNDGYDTGYEQAKDDAIREIDAWLKAWRDSAEFYGHLATYEGPPVDEEVRVIDEVRKSLRERETIPWSPLVEDKND